MSTGYAPAVTSFLALDCRRVRPERLPATVLDAFDSLLPGERLRVVCESAPQDILALFQRERRGAFEWSPAREGPARWEVEVQRRDAEPGTLRRVREAMTWDHQRLDALEEAAFAARGAHEYDEARTRFAAYAHGQRRHVDVEEQILLPEFEQRAGMSGDYGPSVVMRAEHRAIVSLISEIERQIGDPEAPVELARAELRQTLGDHDLKEEQVIYPALDRLLDPLESDSMVARVQAWARG